MFVLLSVLSIKHLIRISCNLTSKDTSFNILLRIGIPELFLNLVSCHVFMKKPNPTVILNFQTHLINNDLSKLSSIIEHNTKQLSFLPSDVKLIINLINQLDKYYFMVKNKAIYAVLSHHLLILMIWNIK